MTNSNYLNADVTPECQGKTFGTDKFSGKVRDLIQSAQLGYEYLKQKFHIGEYQGKTQGD